MTNGSTDTFEWSSFLQSLADKEVERVQQGRHHQWNGKSGGQKTCGVQVLQLSPLQLQEIIMNVKRD